MMKRKLQIVLVIITFATNLLYAANDVHYENQDSVILEQYKLYIKPYSYSSLETILDKTSVFFLNAPYVAHTLEVSPREELIVNLREFDCFTFVETVMALALNVKSGEGLTLENFSKQLQQIRYRDGKLTDYSSRLHYTSDWVLNNELKGLIKNISRPLGGQKETKTINFMSTHRDAYDQLKNDDKMLEQILTVEKEINQRGGFWYLAKDKIDQKSASIPHMAMIAFTTSINGLDITHVGFAYHKNGNLTFIHASSLKEKVVIDEKTLSYYCSGQKTCTGIMVIDTVIQ